MFKQCGSGGVVSSISLKNEIHTVSLNTRMVPVFDLTSYMKLYFSQHMLSIHFSFSPKKFVCDVCDCQLFRHFFLHYSILIWLVICFAIRTNMVKFQVIPVKGWKTKKSWINMY